MAHRIIELLDGLNREFRGMLEAEAISMRPPRQEDHDIRIAFQRLDIFSAEIRSLKDRLAKIEFKLRPKPKRGRR